MCAIIEETLFACQISFSDKVLVFLLLFWFGFGFSFFFFFFATPCSLRDLSSPTWALSSESTESQPLDHQGIPPHKFNIGFEV